MHVLLPRFSKAYGLRVAAAFGGLNKYEQFKDLKAGSEVAVATPGRMIDLIKMKACNMTRCTYLVFDEADRMFDMGFEPQVSAGPRCVLGVGVGVCAVWCSVVQQCGAVWCTVVQCGAAVWCSVVHCGAVWCSSVWQTLQALQVDVRQWHGRGQVVHGFCKW